MLLQEILLTRFNKFVWYYIHRTYNRSLKRRGYEKTDYYQSFLLYFIKNKHHVKKPEFIAHAIKLSILVTRQLLLNRKISTNEFSSLNELTPYTSNDHEILEEQIILKDTFSMIQAVFPNLYTLADLHYNQGYTLRELGAKYNVTYETIRTRLLNFNIIFKQLYEEND